MAQITKLFEWNADLESWTLAATGNGTTNRITTDGTPTNGCLQAVTDGGRNDLSNHTMIWSGTFGTLGVPAGSSIDNVQIKHYSKVAGYTVVDSMTYQVDLLESNDTLVHRATDRTETGLRAWTQYIGSDYDVSSYAWKTTDSCKVKINVDHDIGNDKTTLGEMLFDYLEVVITYHDSSQYKALGANVAVQVASQKKTLLEWVINTVVTPSFYKVRSLVWTAGVGVAPSVRKHVPKVFAAGISALMQFAKGFTGYSIQRKDGVAGEWFTLTTFVGSETTYTDSFNLVDGVEYFYRVSRIRPGLDPSDWSNVQSYTYTAGGGPTYTKGVSAGLTIAVTVDRTTGKVTTYSVVIGPAVQRHTSATKQSATAVGGQLIRGLFLQLLVLVTATPSARKATMKNLIHNMGLSATRVIRATKQAVQFVNGSSVVRRDTAVAKSGNVSIGGVIPRWVAKAVSGLSHVFGTQSGIRLAIRAFVAGVQSAATVGRSTARIIQAACSAWGARWALTGKWLVSALSALGVSVQIRTKIKALSATASAWGARRVQVARRVTGSIRASSTVTRLVSFTKLCIGTLSSYSSVRRESRRVLTALLTTSGWVDRVRVSMRTVIGHVQSSASARRHSARVFVVALRANAVQHMAIAWRKVCTVSLALSGSARRRIERTILGQLTVAGLHGWVRTKLKELTGLIVSGGATAKASARRLLATAWASGSSSRLVSRLKVLSVQVLGLATARRATARILVGHIAGMATAGRIKLLSFVYAAGVRASGKVTRLSDKTVAAWVTVTTVIRRGVAKVVMATGRLGGSVRRVSMKRLAGLLSALGVRSHKAVLGKVLAATVAALATRRVRVIRMYQAGISLWGQAKRRVARTLAGGTSITGLASKHGIIAKLLLLSTSISGGLSKSTGKRIVGRVRALGIALRSSSGPLASKFLEFVVTFRTLFTRTGTADKGLRDSTTFRTEHVEDGVAHKATGETVVFRTETEVTVEDD